MCLSLCSKNLPVDANCNQARARGARATVEWCESTQIYSCNDKHPAPTDLRHIPKVPKALAVRASMTAGLCPNTVLSTPILATLVPLEGVTAEAANSGKSARNTNGMPALAMASRIVATLRNVVKLDSPLAFNQGLFFALEWVMPLSICSVESKLIFVFLILECTLNWAPVRSNHVLW